MLVRAWYLGKGLGLAGVSSIRDGHLLFQHFVQVVGSHKLVRNDNFPILLPLFAGFLATGILAPHLHFLLHVLPHQ